ncbi:hypothetical protein DTO013E5_603 [Penicillium roqueforti]|uniref:uncharacterized protein n=1 Tax=Penicillium roqueforti TaxID=5082 RepID=UPI00190DC747|nr:uncharacterized protein LCP9604111_536 [Penicillium roqueforti]KAF9253010.1 hypothetical protein LCP9604111_536 [Penicillium roqueforti]KAI1838526.1 hypothetical protein CBS147337_251 [Penicillium roqueforti]KAI2723618.1 hypothetical protein CBS147318_549 [Penicillium roqueforti]KAI2731225.1 hypothetical protein CBS147354_334 [Penicillium roqueforti]KAI2746241.1 hypothetical protein DTO012A1_1072 [Penicillium roqueforti]
MYNGPRYTRCQILSHVIFPPSFNCSPLHSSPLLLLLDALLLLSQVSPCRLTAFIFPFFTPLPYLCWSFVVAITRESDFHCFRTLPHIATTKDVTVF